MFWGGAVEGVIDAAPAEVGQFGDELVDVVAADAEDLEAAMSAAVEGYVCGEGDLVAAGQSAAVRLGKVNAVRVPWTGKSWRASEIDR